MHVDSTMAYEIGVLKPYLCKILSRIPSDSQYKEKAEKILDQIKDVTPISDRYIQSDSLYKEFV